MPNAIGTNEIGPSFAAELAGAGLGGLPFSWSSNGTFAYGDAVTPAQKAAIEAVFAVHNPVKSSLVEYANIKQWALATGGFTVTIEGVERTFATDTVSQSLITGKALRLQQPNPPVTVGWQFGAASFVSISAANFMSAAILIADFVQATFDTLNGVMAGIANGTITTAAQVDAAAWPVAQG